MNEGLKCGDEIPKLCQHVIERRRERERERGRQRVCVSVDESPPTTILMKKHSIIESLNAEHWPSYFSMTLFAATAFLFLNIYLEKEIIFGFKAFSQMRSNFW